MLVHGFTATPHEVRSLGDALAAAGFPSHAVRLPGHATTVADLARAHRDAWIETVATAARTLAQQASRVAVAGVSLGALLALALAEDGAVPVHALALCATPLRFADERVAWLRRLAWVPGLVRPNVVVRKRLGRDILDPAARAQSCAYDVFPLSAVVELLRLRARVVRALHRVTQPTIVLHGRHDRTAPTVNVELLRRKLRAKPLEVRVFERSGHVVTEDAERDAVAAAVVAFFERTLATPPA